MATFFCFFVYYIFTFYTVHCITRSAYLTPDNPSNNGAFISALKDVTISTTNKWQIHASDNIGFHLRLTLNQSYAFHNTSNSSLTITIGSNSVPSDTDLEFIVSFSQSRDKYVTYIINLDTDPLYAANHSSYPKCHLSAPYTELATGDIDELCNKNNSHQRDQKVTNDWLNIPFVSRYKVKFPLSFTLTNYPDDYTLITYDDEAIVTPASCRFHGFKTGVPLVVFFAAEDEAERLNVSSVKIMYNDSVSGITTTMNVVTDMNKSTDIVPDIPVARDSNNDQRAAIIIAIFGTCLLICVAVVMWKRTRKVAAKQAAAQVHMHPVNDNANDDDEEPQPQIQVINRDSENSVVSERCDDEAQPQIQVADINDAMEKRDEPEIKNNMETTDGLNKHLSANDIINKAIVKQWLTNTVELPQYLDSFISNGYESMQVIVEIQEISELADIGIVIKEHQTKIKEEIIKLHQDHDKESMEGHGDHGNDEMMTVEGETTYQ